MSDSYTQGLTISWHYHEDWAYIKSKFAEYKPFISLAEHGPIVTINERKYVGHVCELVYELKEKEEIRNLIKVGIVDNKERYKKAQEGKLFLMLLRVMPEYCRQKAHKDFVQFITSNGSIKYIEQLFKAQEGDNLKEIDKKIEEIVSKMVNYE